ncbi:MAG: hypothetical protein AAB425_07835 [Bdellovibrionota bacterium]
MNQLKFRVWMLALLTGAVASPVFAIGTVDGLVDQTHRAFLKRDCTRMVATIREAITNGADPVAQDNLLALYCKAVKSGGLTGVAIDWQLPDEVLKMRVHVYRRVNDRVSYSLRVSGEFKETSAIEQLKITRFPDTVISDKEGGIGNWESNPETEEKAIHFQLKGAESKDAIPSGLYLLSLKMASGATTEGWFLIDDGLNMTEGPRLLEPSNGQAMASANPRVKWDANFRSPQYQPEEKRTLYVNVCLDREPDHTWIDKWSLWTGSPTESEIVVGKTPGGIPAQTQLEKGPHYLTFHYSEQRRFGDLVLCRTNAVSRPFSVK